MYLVASHPLHSQQLDPRPNPASFQACALVLLDASAGGRMIWPRAIAHSGSLRLSIYQGAEELRRIAREG